MQLAYIGDPPSFFTGGKWPQVPFAFLNQPVFTVDALFVFGARPLTVLEKQACSLIERSGRPSVRVGAVNLKVDRRYLANVLFIRCLDPGEEDHYIAWFQGRPRTSYQSIDCDIYDKLESLATKAVPADLTYLRGDGVPVETTTKLLGLKTDRSEEYVRLAEENWVRLDRITRLQGEEVNAHSGF
jgi:transcriptional antiterminator Rof (Rho-off)